MRWMAFVGAMMFLGMPGILLLVYTQFAWWGWRGRWRIAAVVPALVFVAMMIRIVVRLSAGRSNDDYWQDDVVFWGVLCLFLLGMVGVCHAVSERDSGPHERVSLALSDPDPVAGLLTLVRELKDQGISRRDVRALLEAARERHEDDDDEARYNAVLDTLDVVTGHCRPDQEIWPGRDGEDESNT